MRTHICTHGCFYLEWKHLAASCGHLCWLLPTAVYLALAGVSWCCLESRESGLAAQVLSHRSLVTGKLPFHLLSENCQALLKRITRGEMGKAYFFVTDLQKYFTYLGYTSPYCLYTDILFFPICGLSSHFALFPLMKRSFYFKCTVVPQSSQWTGFRTRHRHQNPGMLETHSWHSVSAVPHVWTQPTAVCSTLCIYWEKKKFVYKWTQAVQTHAVQGSTAVKFTDPLLYGLCFIFLTLRNPS